MSYVIIGAYICYWLSKPIILWSFLINVPLLEQYECPLIHFKSHLVLPLIMTIYMVTCGQQNTTPIHDG